MADQRSQAEPIRELSAIAARRHGVVSIEEARSCGLSEAQVRSMVRRGDWRRPRQGLLLSTAAPHGWLQQAAIAAMASRGVLSMRAAAYILGLDGVATHPIELSVDRSRHVPKTPWIVHRVDNLCASDIVVAQGLPVTSMERTIVDLGAVVSPAAVEKALDDALRRGMSIKSLERTLERIERPKSRGCAVLRRILRQPDRIGPIPDSMFERLVERACIAAGLPRPSRQHEVRDRSGRLIARLDLAWPEVLLGVEADSRRFHSGMSQIRSDNDRDRTLMGLGWDLMYVGWNDLKQHDRFCTALGSAYKLRMERLRSG